MKRNLNSLSIEALGNLFPVILTDSDADWINKFAKEKESILFSCDPDDIISISHIGSTAVPGLIAKPTIDILIEIADETDLPGIVAKLKENGYDSIPKPENPPPHLMLAKGYSVKGLTGQTFHVHFRYKGDWDEIVFRDYLIRNPGIANEYAVLKKNLSVEFRNNREKYTEAKTSFIKNIVERAREELKNKR